MPLPIANELRPRKINFYAPWVVWTLKYLHTVTCGWPSDIPDQHWSYAYLETWTPVHPGKEAVGIVSAVGPGVTSFKVGDVVGYADNPMGSYAEQQIIPASVAIPIPPVIDYKTAASVLLKGMTAYVLVRQAFKVSCPFLS